ncbi:MAG: hypothetical protein IT250_17410 [Chitinophagaceae bacterium]|nr:hypothetical protein [Chitinophagaceae bacterium]
MQAFLLVTFNLLLFCSYSQETFKSTRANFQFIIPDGFAKGISKFKSNELTLINMDIGLSINVNVVKRDPKITYESHLQISTNDIEEVLKESFNSPHIIKKGKSIYNTNRSIYYHFTTVKINPDENDYFIFYYIYTKEHQITFAFATKKESYGKVISDVIKIMQSVTLTDEKQANFQ